MKSAAVLLLAGLALAQGASKTPNADEARNAMEDKMGQPRSVFLRRWLNGFTVGSGPLRSYDLPKNQKFLAKVRPNEP